MANKCNVGKSTKLARIQRGMSVEALAVEFGCKPARIYQLEKKPESNTETIDKLYSIFDLNPSEFLALSEGDF